MCTALLALKISHNIFCLATLGENIKLAISIQIYKPIRISRKKLDLNFHFKIFLTVVSHLMV